MYLGQDLRRSDLGVVDWDDHGQATDTHTAKQLATCQWQNDSFLAGGDYEFHT